MSTLHSLRQYLSVEEAAAFLSSELKESVEDSELLSLALERQLTLSINIILGTQARVGRVVSATEAGRHTVWIPTKDGGTSAQHVTNGVLLDDGRVFQPSSDLKMSWVSGIWDLPMVGGRFSHSSATSSGSRAVRRQTGCR